MALGFSQRYGYATHALAYMAKKQFGDLSTLKEIAAWMRSVWPETSELYLSNVIQRLARGGILRSHRGIAGGYSLARPASKISLRDLAGILEGIAPERCALSLQGDCPGGNICNVRRTLCEIEAQYLRSLAKISIEDVAAGMTIKIPKNVSA